MDPRLGIGGNGPPTTDPTLSMILSGSRTLLAAVGGWFIGKGYITADNWAQIGGVVAAIIPLAFGLYSQWKNKQDVKTAYTLPPSAAPNK